MELIIKTARLRDEWSECSSFKVCQHHLDHTKRQPLLPRKQLDIFALLNLVSSPFDIGLITWSNKYIWSLSQPKQSVK
jgi:hypothetical protein